MSLLDAFFGKKPTPREVMRKYKRDLQRTIRELEREKNSMDRQEKKLIREMKVLAKKGQIDTVKLIARDLVRTRQHVKKFYRMKAQLQSVSLKLTTMQSTAAMTNAMSGVARTMKMMNSKMNLPQVAEIMKTFQKESAVFEMKGEMVEDMLDDALEGSDEEAEQEELVSSVLDEIGIEMDGKMKELGGKGTLVAPVAEKKEEDDLEARFTKLTGK